MISMDFSSTTTDEDKFTEWLKKLEEERKKHANKHRPIDDFTYPSKTWDWSEVYHYGYYPYPYSPWHPLVPWDWPWTYPPCRIWEHQITTTDSSGGYIIKTEKDPEENCGLCKWWHKNVVQLDCMKDRPEEHTGECWLNPPDSRGMRSHTKRKDVCGHFKAQDCSVKVSWEST